MVRVKSSALAIEFSTYCAPRTSLRTSSPLSNKPLSIVMALSSVGAAPSPSHAEIGGADVGIGFQVGARSLQDDGAPLENVGPGRCFQGHGRVLLDEQNGRALPVDAQECP